MRIKRGICGPKKEKKEIYNRHKEMEILANITIKIKTQNISGV